MKSTNGEKRKSTTSGADNAAPCPPPPSPPSLALALVDKYETEARALCDLEKNRMSARVALEARQKTESRELLDGLIAEFAPALARAAKLAKGALVQCDASLLSGHDAVRWWGCDGEIRLKVAVDRGPGGREYYVWCTPAAASEGCFPVIGARVKEQYAARETIARFLGEWLAYHEQ